MSAIVPVALLCAAAVFAASGCFRDETLRSVAGAGAVSGAGSAGTGSAPEPGRPEETAAARRETAPAAATAPAPPKDEFAGLFSEAVSRGLPEGGLLLVADSASGKAVLVSKRGAVWRIPFSAASAGIGAAAGSNKTPPGWHRVAERFGAGAAKGTVFVSRRATGRVMARSEWRAPDPAEDAVLTRVMWLEGLEPGVNKGPGIDSHDRYIYLHGTNQEQKLGRPASHGCLRFSNDDVARLFDLAEGVELYCFIR